MLDVILATIDGLFAFDNTKNLLSSVLGPIGGTALAIAFGVSQARAFHKCCTRK